MLSPVDRCLKAPLQQILVIIIKAAVNIQVQICVCIYILSFLSGET